MLEDSEQNLINEIMGVKANLQLVCCWLLVAEETGR